MPYRVVKSGRKYHIEKSIFSGVWMRCNMGPGLFDRNRVKGFDSMAEVGVQMKWLEEQDKKEDVRSGKITKREQKMNAIQAKLDAALKR